MVNQSICCLHVIPAKGRNHSLHQSVLAASQTVYAKTPDDTSLLYSETARTYSLSDSTGNCCALKHYPQTSRGRLPHFTSMNSDDRNSCDTMWICGQPPASSIDLSKYSRSYTMRSASVSRFGIVGIKSSWSFVLPAFIISCIYREVGGGTSSNSTRNPCG